MKALWRNSSQRKQQTTAIRRLESTGRYFYTLRAFYLAKLNLKLKFSAEKSHYKPVFYSYEVEDEMLEYVKKHPKADFSELYQYFTVLVPPGTLPPGADEWEDDEDEE